jgi:glutaredoxin 3
MSLIPFSPWGKSMPKIEIYTTPTCPYCHAAKSLLNEKGAEYTEITVLDPELRAAMTERAHGRRTVPQIFIGETHVGGYDDMAALDRQGGLDPLLQAS